VLVSIFVLSVGLLGVAAVIPAGRVEMVEAMKADRTAVLGRAVLHDAVARGLLNPRAWVARSEANIANWESVVRADGTIRFGDSYAIDPLFVAQNWNTANVDANDHIEWFPYRVLNNYDFRMRRVTIPFGNNRATWLSAAERIFTSHDDLLFPVPKEAGERPRLLLLTDNGVSVPWPVRSSDGVPAPGNPSIGQNQGAFSYLITVTPEVSLPDFQDTSGGMTYRSYVDKCKAFTVCVVVFHKRDYRYPPGDAALPNERSTFMTNFPASMLGCAEVTVLAPVAQRANLTVRENDWLLVRGRKTRGGPINVFKWYRVTAAGAVYQFSAAYSAVQLSISGPDWDGQRTNNEATLFTGVSGVYTTTVELE
jgi:hypothetical protein